jgi:outer membrane receptor for ferric coprogen and ferric-rhodotorulic acid
MRKPDRIFPQALGLVVILATAVMFQVSEARSEPLIRGSKARVVASPGASNGPGSSDSGYYLPYVTGPGGTRVPAMQIPGSVSVVPRSLMDDQQATTLGEALRYVPGVTVGR